MPFGRRIAERPEIGRGRSVGRPGPRRIGLIYSRFAGMSQALWAALSDDGHSVVRPEDIGYATPLSSEDMARFAEQADPDVIFCPFLKEVVPAEVCERWTTWIPHPGILGDAGPSSLSWAVLEGVPTWGLTMVRAEPAESAEQLGDVGWIDATPYNGAASTAFCKRLLGVLRYAAAQDTTAVALAGGRAWAVVRQGPRHVGRWRAGIGTFIRWLNLDEGTAIMSAVAERTERTKVARHEHSADGNVDLDGVPSIVERPHPLSMVYGGGGVFGISYGAGVAEGLARSGIPVASAPSLGTSAGAWVASAVVLGLTYDDFAGMRSPPLPTRHPVVYEAALSLFGDSMHHLVAASAIHLGSRRRHILSGARYPLADLAAASSAVPGLFPPHRIEGRPYIDGGMWSATSIDAAADAQHVIVVAPLAGRVMGPIGRTAGFLLARELQAWRNRHPGATITMIRPNRAIARLAGRQPLALFDADRARQVYPLAVTQGLQWGERMQSATAA